MVNRMENQFLIHATLMGIFITFVYDLLRILRRVIPHGAFFVSLEDMFFWLYCTAEVFLLMYHEGNGSLRWFAILGAMMGMFLYKKLLSELFVKYVSLALKKVLGFVGKILGVVLRPFGVLCKKSAVVSRKATGGIKTIFRRIRRNIKMRLTNFKKMLKINLKAGCRKGNAWRDRE